MNVANERAIGWSPFCLEIGDLTGDQFATARSRRNLANDLCRRVTPGRLCARGDFECNGEKTIAGEDSDAFPKDFVAGGAATTKIVIIHARQIVIHERVGVNAFYRGSERKCIAVNVPSRLTPVLIHILTGWRPR